MDKSNTSKVVTPSDLGMGKAIELEGKKEKGARLNFPRLREVKNIWGQTTLDFYRSTPVAAAAPKRSSIVDLALSIRKKMAGENLAHFSADPIFKPQPFNSLKLVQIIGHQDRVQCKGMGTDPQIVGTDRRARKF